MKTEMIILDLDGLMLDTEREHYKAFSQVCLEIGVEPDLELFKQTIGRGDIPEVEVFRRGYPHIDADKMFEGYMAYRTELYEGGHIPIKTGLFELFDEIERRKIMKIVGTCQFTQVGQHLLMRSGIAPRLEGGVFGDMVKLSKPFPDIYLKCCELYGKKPENCLVVEDSEAGVRAAHAANIPVVIVPDLIDPCEEVLSLCKGKCETLLDVIQYL